jgi:hypothetical protein
MEDLENLKLEAKEKRIQCDIDAKAHAICLSRLAPANIVLVVGGSLLSLIAGASLLVEQGTISKQTAGVLALVSSGFSIIHSKMNCDQYQAECRRLQSLYEGLSEDYSSLQIESDAAKLYSKLETFNKERAQVKKSAGASPSLNCIDRATNIVQNITNR